MKLSSVLLLMPEDTLVIIYEDVLQVYNVPVGFVKLKATKGKVVSRVEPCMFAVPKEAGIEIWTTNAE